jgi:C1A family cysteine protease
MKYGLIRQQLDVRDFQYQYVKVKLPKSIDLRPICPPIFTQMINDCTANAGCSARQMLSGITITLSRHFLYYQERVLLNDTNNDNGATMRSICDALKKYGVCYDSYDMYLPVSSYSVKPSENAYEEALKLKINSYQAVHNLSGIQNFLYLKKQPVLVGIDVFSTFENVNSTGIVKMPKLSERSLGGHAILVVGYKKIGCKWYMIIRNSWGVAFGSKGYCYLPFAYLEKYSYDCWGLVN